MSRRNKSVKRPVPPDPRYDSQTVSKIRIHPTNPDIVFVGVFGKYSVPSAERGVYKSTDGGKSWRKVLYKDDKSGAIDISNKPSIATLRIRKFKLAPYAIT